MISDGPRNAKIVVLGEAPGAEELAKGRPFVGYSGLELERMMTEAGLNKGGCFFFNVTDWRPRDGKFFYNKTEGKKNKATYFKGRYIASDEIKKGAEQCLDVIAAINPNVVIALGDMALWALTGHESVTKWRGSILESEPDSAGKTYKVIPTFNPAFVTRNWPARWLVVQDFRRVFNESLFPEIRYPERNYIILPTFDQAMDGLERARGQLITNDLEVWGGHIACLGIGYNKNEAICIPFASTKEGKEDGYWSSVEEFEIVKKIKDVFTDPSTKIIYQNGHFDLQIFAKEWGFFPNITGDTMVAMHVAFPAMRKALDFMSSLFCKYYRFWKEDGKYWDPNIHGEEQYWIYNCDDCCYTYEDIEVLHDVIEKRGLQRPYEIQMSLVRPTLKMMLRGVEIDQQYKTRIGSELMALMRERAEWFERVLGHPLNPLSNAPTGQMRRLFYEDLQCKPVLDRKTKRPTLNDEALETIKKREPKLKPLVEAVQEYRSLNTFKSNFADMKLSPDGKLRCSINISKVITYRFSTEENIWGEGSNLQNIPKGTEKD